VRKRVARKVVKTRKLSPRLLVASRKELKVAKLEIDPLYMGEKIARNTGAIIRFDTFTKERVASKDHQ